MLWEGGANPITEIFLAQRSKIYTPVKKRELPIVLFLCLRT